MNGKVIRLIFCAVGLLCWLLPCAGRAQPSDLFFTCYTTEQGLSYNGVTALAKDRRGFLWVGTFNGLNRFDGVQFKQYRYTGRPQDLPGNYIMHNGLTADHLGYLWVATTRGLCRFDPVREQGVMVPLPKQPVPQDNQLVSGVSFDRAGQGWFASSYQLYQLDPRTLRLRAFALPYSVPGDFPDVVFDAAGRLWLYFQEAAYRFDRATGRYTYYLGRDDQHPQAHPLQKVARSGAELYALSDQGARRYDAGADRFMAYTAGSLNLYAIAEARTDEGRVVWLGDKGRLTRYYPATQRYTYFQHVPDDTHSYPGGRVHVLLQDTLTGVLWLGTEYGLAILDPQANNLHQQHLPQIDNHQPENVQLVQQDGRLDSLYWLLGRQTGLWRWQAGRLRLVPHPANMGTHWRGLQQDAQGRLWMGLSDGLACYNPTTGQWQRRGTQTQPFSILTLFLDRKGRLWLGTFEQGLYWYDARTDQLRAYPLPAGPAGHHTVRGLCEDAVGQLWVRTSQGLYRLSPNRERAQPVQLRQTRVSLALSPPLSTALLLDRQQHLWISGASWVVEADTAGRVLHTYTLANGLRADQVFGLAEDQRGHLWLATDTYLHELDPAAGTFRYYDRSSGLLKNSVFQNFTQSRQGNLLLGGDGGFNYFQPLRLRRNLVPPPVALTELLVNNQPRPLATNYTIDLHPGETTLTVGFAALGFSQPSKNRYAYRLLGFDPDWIRTAARSATYTNLAPGDYQLRIQAANDDGVWNLTGQTLAVHVQPAYYQTVWFKVVLLIAAGAALWGVYRYREAQRQQVARVRDHIAKDLHDDMGSTLSSIRIFSEVAQGQLAGEHPQTVALLQRISANASTLAESMQDIIWTIKPNTDGLADVVSRMREFALRLTEAKGIVFSMQVEEPFPALNLSLEQRRNLFLIFKESVNNAIKYADCQHLRVTLSLRSRQLQLRIEDDGRGFDPAMARVGNGLANLQARALAIRGTVQVTSVPAAGTTVLLTASLS